jgi:hypothetical protein
VSATTADAAAPAARESRWRRHRSSLLIALGLVTAVFVVLVLGGGSAATDPLDPDNPGPLGGRALAQVLEDQGVEVDVVRSADGLDDAEPGSGTTVLVTSSDRLGETTVERLRAATVDAEVVVAMPGPAVSSELGVEVVGVASDETLQAQCQGSALIALLEGLEIKAGDGFEYAAASGCFSGDLGAVVAQPEDGMVLLGGADVLRNGGILQADNAAVALRLLGQHDRLVWYVPDAADLTGDDAVSLSSLLPDWLMPALWVVALALVALVVWRGRRLGPLVTEPLPVVVRAIETTHSRGRLYRRADDRAHAAATLRAAGRSKVAERLRLPDPDRRGGDPHALIRDVARHLGRPVTEIGYLLHPEAPAPTTDHDLIALANALAELDREVRRT